MKFSELSLGNIFRLKGYRSKIYMKIEETLYPETEQKTANAVNLDGILCEFPPDTEVFPMAIQVYPSVDWK